MNNISIKINDLTKVYKIYERNVVDRIKDVLNPFNKKEYEQFVALNKISLEVKKGEILGIIGRNGAGKSTLLKLISGITTPSNGSIETKGKIVPLLELGGGFNPEYTGRENIYFYCSLLGMKKNEIDEIAMDIIAFSELNEFIDVKLKKYSSGMRSRLGFSVSIFMDPDILILDEVLAVGDELFRRKCIAKMEEKLKGNKTVLFVSHSLGTIKEICSRVILLHEGQIIQDGPPNLVIPSYRSLLRQENSKQARKFIKTNSKKKVKLFDIDLNEISLVDKDGQAVYELDYNSDYLFSFDSLFNEDVYDVSFGIEIYNTYSKNISGGYYPNEDVVYPLIKPGQKFRTSFKFKCNLCPDRYFARVVVRGRSNGIIEPLAYIHDVITFRVNENKIDLFHVTENISFIEARNVGIDDEN